MIQVEFLCQTPMIVAPLFSITAGGSAGPEAPLLYINGSFGWLGEKLKLTLVTTRADLMWYECCTLVILVRLLVAPLPLELPIAEDWNTTSDNPSLERDSELLYFDLIPG